MKPLFETGYHGVYCPLCDKYFEGSYYLQETFLPSYPKSLWIANNITHYRHSHRASWNRCWGAHGSRYRHGWFGDYETEKAKVNEMAKRQLLRKSWQYMRFHKILEADWQRLKSNDKETLDLIRGLLGSGQLNMFE